VKILLCLHRPPDATGPAAGLKCSAGGPPEIVAGGKKNNSNTTFIAKNFAKAKIVGELPFAEIVPRNRPPMTRGKQTNGLRMASRPSLKKAIGLLARGLLAYDPRLWGGRYRMP
jgi:hypothetical protein